MSSSRRPTALDEIVSVHVEAFPGFLLTELGPRFLREYYRCVDEYSQGILVDESDAGGCLGFVAGFVDPASFYRALRRRRARLGLAAAAGLVARPHRLMAVVADYLRAGAAASGPADSATAELSSLAVRPRAAGRGVGTRLVGRFLAAARDRGAARVILTTDADGNESVNGFYSGLGFTCARRFEARPGRWLNEYVIGVAKE